MAEYIRKRHLVKIYLSGTVLFIHCIWHLNMFEELYLLLDIPKMSRGCITPSHVSFCFVLTHDMWLIPTNTGDTRNVLLQILSFTDYQSLQNGMGRSDFLVCQFFSSLKVIVLCVIGNENVFFLLSVFIQHSYILRVVLVIIMEFHWLIGRVL